MVCFGRRLRGLLGAGGAAALVLAACSGTGGDNRIGGGGGSGSAAGGGSGAASGTGGGGWTGTGGGSTGSGGFGALGSGGGGPVGDACALSHNDGKQSPLDMYIMLDRSGSMQGERWTAVTQALKDFVSTSPATDGIGVGLQFFPLNPPNVNCPFFKPPCPAGCVPFGPTNCFPDPNEGCDPNGYLPPKVPISLLPGARSALVTAIDGTSPNGGTPMMPALQSALQATTAYAAQHPDHKVIVVLATDGEPSGCDENVDHIAAVAAAGHNATPSVDTWAIGIGNITALDAIAAAGGTGTAIVVDAASAGQQFLDAMMAIKGKALGCEFILPKPSGGAEIDPNQVNVLFTPTGGQQSYISHVTDLAACKGQEGWYYDNDAAPTKVVLCPSSCTEVKSTNGEAAIDIALGCATHEAPPR
ncbi:MAG: VWA domain-containing protein [Sorangiineae bacterium]|nr:VWA domain-containing protein [Polyangiaceae bacterium]MEB2324514.1 VWA domain-containing protein [Sorangiineae bacterium]